MNERLLKSSLDKVGLPCTGLSIDSSWSTNTTGFTCTHSVCIRHHLHYKTSTTLGLDLCPPASPKFTEQ